MDKGCVRWSSGGEKAAKNHLTFGREEGIVGNTIIVPIVPMVAEI